jgi:hypothetical protein
MNISGVASSILIARANVAAAQKAYFEWFFAALGPGNCAWLLSVGIAVFLGACFVVVKSRRPSVIASYLVLLPLPMIVGLWRVLAGQISSLSVLSLSPAAVANLSGCNIAAGVAAGLLPLFVALMVTFPSYLVLAAGLMFRTAKAGKGSL